MRYCMRPSTLMGGSAETSSVATWVPSSPNDLSVEWKSAPGALESCLPRVGRAPLEPHLALRAVFAAGGDHTDPAFAEFSARFQFEEAELFIGTSEAERSRGGAHRGETR